MATLVKEKVVLNMTDGTLADLSGETVEVLERGASYPGSAIACTAGTGADYRYRPNSDLDTTKAYYVYAGGNIVGTFNGYDSRTNFMGESIINVLNITTTGSATIGTTLSTGALATLNSLSVTTSATVVSIGFGTNFPICKVFVCFDKKMIFKTIHQLQRNTSCFNIEEKYKNKYQ